MFESERLTYRRPLESDLQFLDVSMRDPEVMKYQGGPWSDQRRADWVDYMRWHWSTFGFGHFVGVRKDNGDPIGTFSLKYLNRNPDLSVEVPDLGFTLEKKYWGGGFGTEGARTLVRYAFDVLKFKEISALNYPDNKASAHILRKLGFTEAGMVEVIYHGHNFGMSQKWALKNSKDL